MKERRRAIFNTGGDCWADAEEELRDREEFRVEKGGLGRLFPVLKREGEGKRVDYGAARRRAGRGDVRGEKSRLGREIRVGDLVRGDEAKNGREVKDGEKGMEELEEELHFAKIVEG